jgi:GH24 family phage-related lysozyme (muramidase)
MTFKEKMQKQLERDEKRSSKLYYDTMNIPTIGIGRNLNRGLSEDEIDYLFTNDFNSHLKEMLEAFPWAEFLDEARKGALLNMCFNMGIPVMEKFTSTLGALKEGRWLDAANHARNSLWYSQVGHRGPRIVKQIETGEWQ